MGTRAAAPLSRPVGRAGVRRRPGPGAPGAGGRGIAVRRQRARRGEGDRLREEILEAASRLLFETADADAVSVRAVADAVGVSPPSIYLHFADKDQLMLAVCEAQFHVFDEYVQREAGAVEDPVERLIARGHAYVRFGMEHSAHYRVLFMAETTAQPTPEFLAASGFGRLLDDVTECVESGRFRQADPLLLATGLWAVAHGVTALAIARPNFPYVGSEELLAHLVDVHVNGLVRNASPGPEARRSRTSGRARGRRP
ncbi:MAG TPA: TetR/AcrR family transcriptional regulator [Acidimicrobiales bacterium]|nr:TetR/AcrR family transcriptional regulator [Acidimicrobiales bacterium]